MRISTSSSLMSLFQNQRIEHKQSIKKATILLSNRDSYVKGGDNTSCVYSAKVGLKLGSATSSVLDMINFNYLDIMKQKCDKQFSIIIGGKEYLKSELPTVSADKCKEIKAVNNIIDFTNGQYYKYTEKDGRVHTFTCTNDHVDQPYSELVSGRQSDASYQVAKFWNMLSRDGTYISLYYSKEKQEQLLNDAGITEGFFTVKSGKHQQEYFYSQGSAGVAVRKFEYDSTYEMFTRGSALFNKYNVGDKFMIGGKEYTLTEERKFDIPYGDDIFDIEFPDHFHGEITE
ncbi:MAG: hypothetical protein IJC76_08315 [Lachnospiraceae bacterium]|nr:hypothetical protein [Lachnospiraceae bacterium]